MDIKITLRFFVMLACAAGTMLPAANRVSGLDLPSFFLRTDAGYTAWNFRSPAVAAAGGIRFSDGASHELVLSFLNSNLGVLPEGIDPIATEFHRLSGSEDGLIRTDAQAFRGTIYRDIYPGIDFVVHLQGRRIKSEYRVAPGARADRILFRYIGAASVAIGEDGSLEARGAVDNLSESAPEIYQIDRSVRKRIRGEFSVNADGAVGFRIGSYDPSLPLVIDPILSYTSQFNGNQSAAITAIASDAHGNVYATGYTSSSNLPVASPFQPTSGGGNDVFVLKLNPQGNTLLYATYLGGSGDDRAFGIAIDSQGEAVIVGQTQSQNFPLSSSFQPRLGGGADAFVAKLNASGNGLIFSTLLGGSGSDAANAVTIDGSGNIYVTGDTTSTNFPVLLPYQGQNAGRQDIFAAKLTPFGSLTFSTLLGGTSDDHAAAITLDGQRNIYLTGSTYSLNFPVASPFQAQTGGGQDAFITELNVSGTALLFSTYLGGSGGSPGSPEGGSGIGVDSFGNIFVAGTTSSTNFPVLNSNLGFSHSYGTDLFLAKFGPSGGALLFSTYLGGSSYDFANGFALDGTGCAYLTGQTSSLDLPLANTYQATAAGLTDAFILKVSTDGGTLEFGSYLGGSGPDSGASIALDHLGNLYVAGTTQSYNFPQNGGIAPQAIGSVTGFVSKITTAGDHAPLLNRLYLGFLNRLPDPIGMAGWSASLDGGLSPAQLANNFFYSPEFYNSGVIVAATYFAVQGRDPDFNGFESNLAQVRSGSIASQACLNGPGPNNTPTLCSQQTLINTFMSSSYYQNTYNSLSNSQFIAAVYQNLLNQTVSNSLVNTLVGQLIGGQTRAQFLQTIINTNQYTNIIQNRLLVDLCYFVFLQRNPDPMGYQGWLYQVNNGMTPPQLFSQFVSSTEFLNSL